MDTRLSQTVLSEICYYLYAEILNQVTADQRLHGSIQSYIISTYGIFQVKFQTSLEQGRN